MDRVVDLILLCTLFLCVVDAYIPLFEGRKEKKRKGGFLVLLGETFIL